METTQTTFNFNQFAEVELVYRTKVKPCDRPILGSSKDTYKLLLQYWNLDTIEFVEEVKILLVNAKSRLLGIYNVATGATSHAIADPKVIFVAALKAHAYGIILCHNHPSGVSQPSHADQVFTQKLLQGGQLLDILLVDHLIITKEDYFSFGDEGLL